MKFYAYEHVRKDSMEVFYVGKGSGNRYLSKANRNQHWHNIVNKTEYEARIVERFEDEESAFFAEQLLISKYGRVNNGTGTLVNKTDGGEGPSGQVFSEEAKQKMRESAAISWDDTRRIEKSSCFKKIWAELKEAGILYEVEKKEITHQYKSDAGKKRYQDPTARKKTSDAMKAYYATEKGKAVRSEQMKKVWAKRKENQL